MADANAVSVDKDGLYAEPFLVLDPGMHTASIRRLVGDAQGRFLVTGSLDKSLRVWSAEDGRLLNTIRLPSGPGDVGKVYAVAMSPDGETVAASGWTEASGLDTSVYLFERATGRAVARIPGLPNVVLHLAFSPDGGELAVALAGKNGVRLFDAHSRRELAKDTDYGAASYGIAFAEDGRIATTSYDGLIRLYGPKLTLLRPAAVAPDGTRPFGIAFSPDGSRIALGYEDTTRVSVLDGRTLEVLAAPDTRDVDSGDLSVVAWSADGKLLYAGGRWRRSGKRPVRTWPESGAGEPRDQAASESTIVGLSPTRGGRLAVASAEPRLCMSDRQGALLWQTEPVTADFRDQLRMLASSADGTQVRFGFDYAGKSPACFDLRERHLETEPTNARSELQTARTDGLDIKDWEDGLAPTLAGRPLALFRDEMSRSLAVTPDEQSFVLGAEWSLRRFDKQGAQVWEVPVPSIAWAVTITGDGRLVVAAYADGTIRWHLLSDGTELLAFFPHRDGKRWVAWTPLGHYMASPGGEELIQWQINQGFDNAPQLYSASRFRDRFYRPDVVERVLDTLDPAAALAAANSDAGRREGAKLALAETPPRVSIIDPAEGTFVATAKLTVAGLIEDSPGTLLRRVRLLADGRVAAEARGLVVPANGRLVHELEVTLQGNASILTLFAESAQGSSDPSTVQIRHDAVADSFKPALYVLAVGVARFRHAAHLTLNYADADAKAFVAHLKHQERWLYRQVQDRSLVNEGATAEAILDGLEWLERAMTARDVAVVFFSTHGANDANGEFFLLPHDVSVQDDIKLRRSGLRYADIRSTLSRLADRGKTLVFLDACRSGNVIPGAKSVGMADVDKVAADLANADTGVIVFSSSTGKQISLESSSVGHGYFTHALLEAFQRKSDLAPPWLRASDLGLWVSQRVKDLSDGAQTPMMSVPGERFTNPVIFRMLDAAG